MKIIAAMTKDRVIGNNNRLPWDIPEELDWFHTLTTGETVIMGRKTYESIGHPLSDRVNIVLSNALHDQQGIHIASSLDHALDIANKYKNTTYVIGGVRPFTEALPRADELLISWVRHDYPGDTRFPPITGFRQVFYKAFEEFIFCRYCPQPGMNVHTRQ
ncbi:dihydrofolate reductase [Candidatus Woesearchaeota archaeon]|nr:dihydrofolate reductase [Candidatus Woesearchaeota archaeon]